MFAPDRFSGTTRPIPTDQIGLAPRSVLTVCGASILVLALAHVAMSLCLHRHVCGPAAPLFYRWGHLFDLGAEGNVPTWFSAAQLACVALALAVVAMVAQDRGRWIGLALLFIYLSLDEGANVHGVWTELTMGASLPGAREGFDWVIAGAVIVAAVAALYLPWVLRLPARTRRLFVLAGAMYVGGGLGLEVVGAYTANENYNNTAYLLASFVEELLEMLAITVMLYAALDLLRGRRITLRVAP